MAKPKSQKSNPEPESPAASSKKSYPSHSIRLVPVGATVPVIRCQALRKPKATDDATAYYSRFVRYPSGDIKGGALEVGDPGNGTDFETAKAEAEAMAERLISSGKYQVANKNSSGKAFLTLDQVLAETEAE